MPEATRPKLSAGPVLVILGGILVLISGFTDWGKVSPPAELAGPVTIKGSGIVLAVGVILAVVGVAMWAVRTRGAHIAFGVIAILAGLAATLIAGVSVGSKDVLISTAADKYAENAGASSKEIETALKQLDSRGQLDVEVKLGLWLGLVGGVLVLVGGIAGIVKAPKKETAAGAPMGFEAPAGGPPAPPTPGAPPPPPPAEPPPPPGPAEPGSGPGS